MIDGLKEFNLLPVKTKFYDDNCYDAISSNKRSCVVLLWVEIKYMHEHVVT